MVSACYKCRPIIKVASSNFVIHPAYDLFPLQMTNLDDHYKALYNGGTLQDYLHIGIQLFFSSRSHLRRNTPSKSMVGCQSQRRFVVPYLRRNQSYQLFPKCFPFLLLTLTILVRLSMIPFSVLLDLTPFHLRLQVLQ